MTDREKAIVMAYTEICMLTGDKFQIFHKYIEDILGRPVMTHELAFLADVIKKRSKADFIELCKDGSDSIKALEQEPCEDCISRQAVLEIVEREQNKGDALFGIEQLPPVTPQPKTGHWILVDDCERFIAKCSECGRTEDSRMIYKYPFCHCGARMKEVRE